MREHIAKILRIPQVYALLFWLLVLGVVAVAFDSLIMPAVAGQWTGTEAVPGVVGKPSAEAEKILVDADLKFLWSKEGRYSSQVPAGHVLFQRPAAGRTVKDGRTVVLTVSKGLREAELPDLRGKSLRQAEISLNRLGLRQGKVIEGAHASIPRGVVIRTEPAAGSPVRMGENVNIVVSSGKSGGKEMLPNLADQSMDKAFQVLDSLEFQVGEVTRKPGTGKLPNTVLEQSPRSGEYLAPGSKVDLTVAD
jgi:eukaryotic-like serine/threonine-protein kinase